MSEECSVSGVKDSTVLLKPTTKYTLCGRISCQVNDSIFLIVPLMVGGVDSCYFGHIIVYTTPSFRSREAAKKFLQVFESYRIQGQSFQDFAKSTFRRVNYLAASVIIV